MKVRRDQHALAQQAAAVAAQVEHDALGALVDQLVELRAQLAVRALREAEQLHVRDLLAVALDHLAVGGGDVDLGALERQLASLSVVGVDDLSVTFVPALPLILAVARRAGLAGDRLALDAGDQVVLLDAGSWRGRAVVDLPMRRPRGPRRR